MALIVADLDGFEKINDGYGHGTGDALLGAFAKRLRAGVREGYLVARLGGDEFAAVLPVVDLAVLERWLERTLTHLDPPRRALPPSGTEPCTSGPASGSRCLLSTGATPSRSCV